MTTDDLRRLLATVKAVTDAEWHQLYELARSDRAYVWVDPYQRKLGKVYTDGGNRRMPARRRSPDDGPWASWV